MRTFNSIFEKAVASTGNKQILLELLAPLEKKNTYKNLADTDFLEEMDKHQDCRSIILSSEGKHFCAGADFTRSSYKEESDPYEKLYKEAVRLFKTKKPVIATIQGAAVGGGLGVALSLIHI